MAGKPGRPPKITDQAIEATQKMLVCGWLDSQIRRVLAAQFGIDKRDTADRVLRRARERNVEAIKLPLEDLRAEAAGYYFSVLRADDRSIEIGKDSSGKKVVRQLRGASVLEKIRARRMLDRILGLDGDRESLAPENQNKPPVVRRLMHRPGGTPPPAPATEASDARSEAEPAPTQAPPPVDRQPPVGGEADGGGGGDE